MPQLYRMIVYQLRAESQEALDADIATMVARGDTLVGKSGFFYANMESPVKDTPAPPVAQLPAWATGALDAAATDYSIGVADGPDEMLDAGLCVRYFVGGPGAQGRCAIVVGPVEINPTTRAVVKGAGHLVRHGFYAMYFGGKHKDSGRPIWSVLGAPAENEHGTLQGAMQRFEWGALAWNRATGEIMAYDSRDSLIAVIAGAKAN